MHTICTSRRAEQTATSAETKVFVRTTTTLYDLIAAIQSVVEPNDDDAVVGTVLHILRTHRVRWCDHVAA
jgi:hypothetical protein